ncbi:hypothetical protein ACLQ9R_08335 [Bordetella hinzii]|uniref:hypothetical protein n=1 Tax=Bordetella hinzii TaxID=103855 RepID=UPI0012D346AC|nr:hypothetical protein [Bordetella hinzii]QWF39486.1 hypothetical protein HHA25_14945 [Bordetella hinzii]QWF44033.1 hypothetical protein HHA24_14940 [Bordetella hinzii]QWF48569.1 hypothetical protein HHA23_14940 [Bordetella hinzii]QWF53106.1 hypothetical protein HHA22_14945 [Bordetella hinzii]QWF57595.1 hypothetical protein HHA21_14700 [Bordetella hinzii]
MRTILLAALAFLSIGSAAHAGDIHLVKKAGICPNASPAEPFHVGGHPRAGDRRRHPQGRAGVCELIRLAVHAARKARPPIR